MLERARRRAAEFQKEVDLRLGDAQALDFPSASFNSAVATWVFCSVPDPVLGLRELKRVVKPGGHIYLLEHMRSPEEKIGKIMDLVSPLVVRIMGANINRKTIDNIQRAGLTLEQVEDLAYGGIFKLIIARVPSSSTWFKKSDEWGEISISLRPGRERIFAYTGIGKKI